MTNTMTRKRVAYWGPKWSFTYLAALQVFPDDDLIPFDTPRTTFRAIESDDADFCVLPVENSTVGAVTETLQLLAEQPQQTPIKIVDEHFMPIEQFLMTTREGVTLHHIEAVLSNKVARDQCEQWLEGSLPKADFVSTRTTAEAAERLAKWEEENGKIAAAIGPEQLATHYGRNILVKRIQDQKNNATRFLVLSKDPRSGGPARRKMTLVLILHDKPGSLARTLQFLASRDLNMAQLKMTPVRSPAIFDWKDWLFLDISVPITDGEVKQICIELADLPEVFHLKPLGIYPDRSMTKQERMARLFPEGDNEFVVSPAPGKGVQRIIVRGESHETEFKSALRWDFQQEKRNPDIEIAIAKTIVGFMNAEGGVLLIGVGDAGQIIGIESDLKTLSSQTTEAFYRALVQVVENHIGKEYAPLVKADFEPVDGKTVCLVRINKSRGAAYLRIGGNPVFFVRIGNSTRPMNTEEALRYISDYRKGR